MAIAPLQAGFVPVTAPKHYKTYAAAATVYKFGMVYLSANGTVTLRPDAGTQVPCGVALNYATAGEDVTVCNDPFQIYRIICTGIPVSLRGQIGYYGTTSGNATAKTSAPHFSNATLSAASLASAATTNLCILFLGPDKIVENPYGDGTGVGSVANSVLVRFPTMTM